MLYFYLVNRLVAGLRQDPLRKLTALLQTPRWIKGKGREKGKEKEGKGEGWKEEEPPMSEVC